MSTYDLSRMNDALCDFAMRWKVDGAYMRCRKCNRACCASYVDEAFQHASDGKAAGKVERSPWRAFINLLGPINTHPPRVTAEGDPRKTRKVAGILRGSENPRQERSSEDSMPD
jgi:hypothetical protein